MPAHAFIVTYRHDDPRIRFLQGGTIFAGRCGNCGHNTYANQSGIDAIKTRDAVVFCSTCAIEHGLYDHFVSDLSLS